MHRRSFITGALGTLGAAALGGSARAQYQPQAAELVARIVAAQAEDGAILMPGSGSDRHCNPSSPTWP